MEIPAGGKVLRVKSFNEENSNSCVTNYYQIGPGNIYQDELVDLLVDFMSEPCYNQLRTVEQLGYAVGCTSQATFGVIGFSVYVNSPADKFSCTHVADRIETFLEDFITHIKDLSDEELKCRIQSQIKAVNCADMNMTSEVSRWWSEITDSTYIFDRPDQKTDYLKNLNLEEFQEWSENVLDKIEFKKLSIQVVGYGEKALDECIPSDMNNNSLLSEHGVYQLQFLLDKEKDKEPFVQEISSFKKSLRA